MNKQRITPAVRYLRYLASAAHEAGLPFLPINDLSSRQVSEWIAYLRDVIATQDASPYLVTPARERLPASYVPPWQDLPDAFDHEHMIGTVTREDGIEQCVCVLCGETA